MSEFKINCLGRDRVSRRFSCEETQDEKAQDEEYKKWSYRVRTIPEHVNGEFFEMSVEQINDSTVRITMANHFNVPEYVAKGIPDSLIPEIKKRLGKSVESSPKQGVSGTYRTAEATTYWERLYKNKVAAYDKDRDVYIAI